MKDDTSAVINLARMYTDGGHVLREDDAKASELFKRAADLGSAEAIGELAVWQNGRFDYSVPDRTTAKNIEDAARKGDVPSCYNLAAVLAREDNYDLVIKH